MADANNNKLCSFSALKEEKSNSPFLQYEVVDSFQWIQYVKGWGGGLYSGKT